MKQRERVAVQGATKVATTKNKSRKTQLIFDDGFCSLGYERF